MKASIVSPSPSDRLISQIRRSRHLWWLNRSQHQEYWVSLNPLTFRQNRKTGLAQLIVLLSLVAALAAIVAAIGDSSVFALPTPWVAPLGLLAGMVISLPSARLYGWDRFMPFSISIIAVPLLVVYCTPLFLVNIIVGMLLLNFARQNIPLRAIWNAQTKIWMCLFGWYTLRFLLSHGFTVFQFQTILYVSLAILLASFLTDFFTKTLAELTSRQRIPNGVFLWTQVWSTVLGIILISECWLATIELHWGLIALFPISGFITLIYLAKRHDGNYLTTQQQAVVTLLSDTMVAPRELSTRLPEMMRNFLDTWDAEFVSVFWVDRHRIGHAISITDKTHQKASTFQLSPTQEITGWLKEMSVPLLARSSNLLHYQLTHRGEVVGQVVAGDMSETMGNFLESEKKLLHIFTERLNRSIAANYLAADLDYTIKYDALTGCLNSATFYQQLNSQLELPGGYTLLAFLDIDDFKQVNDRWGHDAGDQAIQIVAQRLKEQLPSDACIARLHGDEFAWFHSLPAISPSPELQARYQELSHQLASPAAYAGADFALSCSVGVVTSANSSQMLRDLMEAADRAMYFGKQQGKAQLIWKILEDTCALTSTPAISTPEIIAPTILATS